MDVGALKGFPESPTGVGGSRFSLDRLVSVRSRFPRFSRVTSNVLALMRTRGLPSVLAYETTSPVPPFPRAGSPSHTARSTSAPSTVAIPQSR